MKSSVITLVGLVACAIAVPTTPNTARQLPVCSEGSPQCCDVDVLGVADLDCSTPPSTPTDAADFTNICAAIGKIDMCCLLPVLEQGLICNKPA
ncbi:Bhp2, hydrophobin class II [Xylogone sp. PMI_703]|nr:Bhp2, hydrophobin class II [Xylogone sp. PMI_703]